MKIGIDIDNILTYGVPQDYMFGAEFCRMMNRPYQYDPTSPSVKGQFQLTDSLYDKFMDIYFKRIVNESVCDKEAVRVLKEMHNGGDDLYIITARMIDYDKKGCKYSGKQMANDTIKWFYRNDLSFIPLDHFIFRRNNIRKVDYCKKLGIELMIEDNPIHFIPIINNKIHTIVFDYPFNMNYMVDMLIDENNASYLHYTKTRWHNINDIIRTLI